MNDLVSTVRALLLYHDQGTVQGAVGEVLADMGEANFRQGLWTVIDLLNLHFNCRVSSPKKPLTSEDRQSNTKALLAKYPSLNRVVIIENNVATLTLSDCSPRETQSLREIVTSLVRVPVLADPGDRILARLRLWIARRILGRK